MGDEAARDIRVPRLDLPPNINEILERLPIYWKNICVELIRYAELLQNIIEEFLNVSELENLVNATTPPDATTLAGVMEKCKNLKEGLKNAVNDFVCNGRPSCEENFEQRKATKDDILKQLNDEKAAAANSWLYVQAMLGGALAIVEIRFRLSVWRDIENAENIIKTGTEGDIHRIEERIKNLKNDEKKLLMLMEQNIRGGSQQSMEDMQTLTSRLILYINATKNMISQYIVHF